MVFDLMKIASKADDKNEKPSIITNPFAISNLKGVSMFGFKSASSGEWSFHGVVEFSGGATGGTHRVQGKTLAEVAEKLDAVIKSLS